MLYLHFSRPLQIVEQRKCGQCYLPVSLEVVRFAHREVVRERYEADSRGHYAVLHGQRNGGNTPLFNGVADQPYGLVAQRSRGR
jgi:hypothetical protein